MCGPTGIPGEGAFHQLPTYMPPPARTLRFKLLLSTVLVVSAVLTSATAASVFVASDAARRTVHQPQAGEFSLNPYRHTTEIHALLDSLLTPLDASSVLDSATLRAVVALTAHTDSHDERPGSNTVWIANPVPAPDSLGFAQVALLRTWARSAPLPPLWGYRTGLGRPATPWELPTRAWRPLMLFIRQNEHEADSALLKGDVATATLRAQETIAAARHFTGQPTMMDMIVGRAIMMRGAKLLARTARQADQPTRSAQATRLAEFARVSYAIDRPQMVRLHELGAELSDGRLQAIAADRSLPAGIRMATLNAALLGACLRTREVLLGATAERNAAMAQLARAVSDIGRTEELTPAYFKALAEFDEPGPIHRLRGIGRRHEADDATPVQWMVSSGVRMRYAFCRSVM